MTELNDGFGDSLDYDQILREEKEFFNRITNKHEPGKREDARQEAMIAAWRSLEKTGGNRAYMNRSASLRVKEHIYRDQWFGQNAKHGGVNAPVDPLRREYRDSLDDPDFDQDVVADDVIEKVMWAYHEGEIREALESLSIVQKEYVVLRFWGGYTNSEIAELRKLTRSGVASTWNKYVRPQLAEMLEHLTHE